MRRGNVDFEQLTEARFFDDRHCGHLINQEDGVKTGTQFCLQNDHKTIEEYATGSTGYRKDISRKSVEQPGRHGDRCRAVQMPREVQRALASYAFAFGTLHSGVKRLLLHRHDSCSDQEV